MRPFVQSMYVIKDYFTSLVTVMNYYLHGFDKFIHVLTYFQHVPNKKPISAQDL